METAADINKAIKTLENISIWTVEITSITKAGAGEVVSVNIEDEKINVNFEKRATTASPWTLPRHIAEAGQRRFIGNDLRQKRRIE